MANFSMTRVEPTVFFSRFTVCILFNPMIATVKHNYNVTSALRLMNASPNIYRGLLPYS